MRAWRLWLPCIAIAALQVVMAYRLDMTDRPADVWIYYSFVCPVVIGHVAAKLGIAWHRRRKR